MNEEDKLYATFKQTNWGAKNSNLWVYVCALYMTCVLTWMLTPSFDITVQAMGNDARAIPLMVFIVFAVILFVLALIRYFTHDRPWNAYQKKMTPPEDNWTSNCGGILKIYD